MSRSEHPIARHLHSYVNGSTKLLATVMILPLIDGIFPALILAGALDSLIGIIQVGLLVFGGSATVAVILTEMDSTVSKNVKSILLVGVPLIFIAGVEAAIAPMIKSGLNLLIFQRFAALVIIAIAAKTVSARVGELLPRPSIIVGLGFVGSLSPSTFIWKVTISPPLIGRAMAAGVVGVGFAIAVVLLKNRLLANLNVARFRFGTAIALGILAVSLFEPAFTYAPLAVLGVTTTLAFEPDGKQPSTPADGEESETMQMRGSKNKPIHYP